MRRATSATPTIALTTWAAGAHKRFAFLLMARPRGNTAPDCLIWLPFVRSTHIPRATIMQHSYGRADIVLLPCLVVNSHSHRLLLRLGQNFLCLVFSRPHLLKHTATLVLIYSRQRASPLTTRNRTISRAGLEVKASQVSSFLTDRRLSSFVSPRESGA